MPLGPGRHTSWPYARGSPQDSVGKFRGTLRTSLALMSAIYCWEAKDEARKVFDSGHRAAVVDFLKKHSDKAQESGSYLFVGMLIVGRRPEQAKPTVMFVPDDKAARKEAFHFIKGSGVMAQYPGFEIGHTDFEKLMALGGAAVVEIFSLPHHDRTEPHRLFHFPSERSGLPVGTATAGGIISYRGKYMYLSVSHFLDDAPPALSVDLDVTEGVTQDADSDCEITGLDDFDAHDTSFVDTMS